MMDIKNGFEGLVSQVIEKTSNPEDHFEVVALLESLGWNDIRATNQFGADDLFELGSMIYDAIQKRGVVANIAPLEKVGLLKMTLILIRSFLRGVIFALPMGISVISMLTLKMSLWSYQYLSTEFATSIAIATILSFITVGGFTQAIARRSCFYINQFYYNMARKMTLKFIQIGYMMALVIIAALFIFNIFFNFFPLYMMAVIVIYYLMLCAVWLLITVIYILKIELYFSLLFTGGIGLVYFLIAKVGMDPIFSQIIGLSALCTIGMVTVFLYFRYVEMKMEKGIAAKLPRMSITLYSVLPYFIYGFVYFAFLYIDRVMAWSTNDVFMPYLIWFRGEYELGMDFGLLTMMIPMGINEVLINKFVMNIEHSQKNIQGSNISSFNALYYKMYLKNFVIASIVSVGSSIGLFFIVRAINDQLVAWEFSPIINSEVTWFVFVWSMVGYTLVSVALLNAVTMFSLSSPGAVNSAAIMAFITSAVVGFLMSRWFGYYFAIFGMIAGAVVFLVLTTLSAFLTVKSLDFQIYYTS